MKNSDLLFKDLTGKLLIDRKKTWHFGALKTRKSHSFTGDDSTPQTTQPVRAKARTLLYTTHKCVCFHCIIISCLEHDTIISSWLVPSLQVCLPSTHPLPLAEWPYTLHMWPEHSSALNPPAAPTAEKDQVWSLSLCLITQMKFLPSLLGGPKGSFSFSIRWL